MIIWNYGYKSEVVTMTPSKTGKTINFMLRCFEDGKIRPRKIRAESLVVLEERTEAKKPESQSVKPFQEKTALKTKKSQKPENKIAKAIRNRKETPYGIYADIGTVLDEFSTVELVDYYLHTLNHEGDLRYYLEQQIIAGEINKIKHGN